MITLTKNKIVYSNDYNPECDKYVKREVDHLYLYLNERVVLSDDFTLEDLFHHLYRDGETFDLIFSSCLGHHSLQPWFDEINRPGPKKDDEIDYLEIHRWAEYWDWGDIDLSIGVSGISKKSDIPYGIGFTPLNEIKHLPLRLNEDFEIGEVKIPPSAIMYPIRLLKKIGVPLGKLGKWSGSFYRTFVKGKVEFTVYELITAVLYEISWYGDPTKRDEKMCELEKITEESMEHPERFIKFNEGDYDG